MARQIVLARLVICLACTCGATAALAQSPQELASRPAGLDEGSLTYEVIAVKGKVRIGPSDLDPKSSQGWSYVQVGYQVRPGTKIHVPFRGALKLVARPAEPPTVVLIEKASLINFSEIVLSEGVAKTRIELGYGAIRAGVAEGRTRSDMEIKAPVATLSKRGTDIFRFEYRNGQFMMSMTDQGRGMIQAIQMRATAFGARTWLRSRLVTPGQFVTHEMVRAIEEAHFDRQINVNDVFGLMGPEQLAALLSSSGLGFLIPQGGNLANFLDVPTQDGRIGVVPDFDPDAQPAGGQLIQPPLPPTLRQNVGDFGIGQGNVPSVFGSGAKRIGRDLKNCRQGQHTKCRSG